MTASAQQNKELFWGLRGGGGNFGVATSFDFQLHPVDPVMIGGELIYSFADAPAVLKFMFEIRGRTCPKSSTWMCHWCGCPTISASCRSTSVTAAGCDAADKVLAPLRRSASRSPTRSCRLRTSSCSSRAMNPRRTARSTTSRAASCRSRATALVDVMIATVADAKLPVVQVGQHASRGRRDRARRTRRPRRSRSAPIQLNMFVLAAWQDPALSDAAGQWTRGAWKKRRAAHAWLLRQRVQR